MSASIIDALPYYDKQVEAPGAKAKVDALIEAELAQTPRVAEDDPRLGPDVDVFPVRPVRFQNLKRKLT